jgi:hypothetical protein
MAVMIFFNFLETDVDNNAATGQYDQSAGPTQHMTQIGLDEKMICRH